jgi:general secretion pathway protein D
VSQGISQFSAGALVGHSRELLAYLSLQENASHAHVISEPSLIATDSIPASINVGTQVPVLTSQVSTAVQISATNAYNQSISGVSTGATLQVNARVTPSGVVTLIINQEISAPSPSNPTGNALTPSFDQQVVQTQITMQDGDTIAIGGLIKQTGTWASAGIPLLSKIPYLGILFGSKTYSTERSELIIFMTPHIIYDEADLIEASDELAARVKKLRKYVRQ